MGGHMYSSVWFAVLGVGRKHRDLHIHTKDILGMCGCRRSVCTWGRLGPEQKEDFALCLPSPVPFH